MAGVLLQEGMLQFRLQLRRLLVHSPARGAPLRKSRQPLLLNLLQDSRGARSAAFNPCIHTRSGSGFSSIILSNPHDKQLEEEIFSSTSQTLTPTCFPSDNCHDFASY